MNTCNIIMSAELWTIYVNLFHLFQSTQQICLGKMKWSNFKYYILKHVKFDNFIFPRRICT